MTVREPCPQGPVRRVRQQHCPRLLDLQEEVRQLEEPPGVLRRLRGPADLQQRGGNTSVRHWCASDSVKHRQRREDRRSAYQEEIESGAISRLLEEGDELVVRHHAVAVVVELHLHGGHEGADGEGDARSGQRNRGRENVGRRLLWRHARLKVLELPRGDVRHQLLRTRGHALSVPTPPRTAGTARLGLSHRSKRKRDAATQSEAAQRARAVRSLPSSERSSAPLRSVSASWKSSPRRSWWRLRYSSRRRKRSTSWCSCSIEQGFEQGRTVDSTRTPSRKNGEKMGWNRLMRDGALLAPAAPPGRCRRCPRRGSTPLRSARRPCPWCGRTGTCGRGRRPP